MGDLVLETARLVLRKPQEGDAQLQMIHLNTPAVMEHLGGPKELHEIEGKHAKAEASFAREGFGFMMAIEKATGELAGYCGLKRVDHPLAKNLGDLEIGWLMREDRWDIAKGCFDFLPTRAQLDLHGWADVDIFSHRMRRAD